jgi:Uma2 family endonuclease
MDGHRHSTVTEFHKLIDLGILTEDDKVDLLEGLLVLQERRSLPHEYTRHAVFDALAELLPGDWTVRNRGGITLTESELVPDVAVVRGDVRSYTTRHPGPADFGILIEIADTTIAVDRTTRHRVYARDGIPVYWIVNLVDRQVEVYQQPTGASPSPTYGAQRIYKPGDSVPVVLGGVNAGAVAVVDLLP